MESSADCVSTSRGINCKDDPSEVPPRLSSMIWRHHDNDALNSADSNHGEKPRMLIRTRVLFVSLLILLAGGDASYAVSSNLCHQMHDTCTGRCGDTNGGSGVSNDLRNCVDQCDLSLRSCLSVATHAGQVAPSNPQAPSKTLGQSRTSPPPLKEANPNQ
jgi:hypothetical protein